MAEIIKPTTVTTLPMDWEVIYDAEQRLITHSPADHALVMAGAFRDWGNVRFAANNREGRGPNSEAQRFFRIVGIYFEKQRVGKRLFGAIWDDNKTGNNLAYYAFAPVIDLSKFSDPQDVPLRIEVFEWGGANAKPLNPLETMCFHQAVTTVLIGQITGKQVII